MMKKPSYEELEKRIRELEQSESCFRKSEKSLRTIIENIPHRDVPRDIIADETLHRYEYIISTSNDHMSFIDQDYVYLAVNEACCMAHKKERREIIGNTVADLLDGNIFEQKVKKQLDRCLDGEEIHYQDWFDFPGAGRRYMDVSYFPYTGIDGTISGIVISSHDITERMEVEQQLHIEHSRLSSILDAIPDGIYIVDQNFNIQYINSIIREEFGPVEGRKCYQYFHDRTESCPWCKNKEVFAGKSVSWKWYSSKANKHFILYDSPITNIDETISKFEIFHDISNLKKAEDELELSKQKFKTFAEFTYDWEYWIAPDNQLIYISPSCKRITGYSQEEFMSNPELLMEIIHPEDKVILIEHKHMVEESDDVFPLEFRIITKDGDERWIGHVCQPVYDSEDDFLGIRGSNRDITEYKKMHGDILKSQKLESLGILAGGIAHDFNNLLFVMLGNISLVRDDVESDGETYPFLKAAEDACIKAKELTARLITFSTGGRPVKRMISIGNLIKETTKNSLKGSKIKTEFSVDDAVGQLKIDKEQIRQVIINIVLNAKEAMDGKGKLRISYTETDISADDFSALTPGKYLRVSFEDQGRGIPEENLGKIFDPYFSTKDMGNRKGQGLGLTVCHSIIEKHGGIIGVESLPEAGSKFSIYLPTGAVDVERELPRVEKNTVAEKPSKTSCIGTGKILIMDDEENIRTFISVVLGKEGYITESCAEGKKTIEIYKKAMKSETPFDAVILDLTNKIGMGGRECMRKLLEIDPDARGIIITGYSDDPVITNYMKYGFSAFLIKPARREELIKVINDVLSEANNHELLN